MTCGRRDLRSAWPAVGVTCGRHHLWSGRFPAGQVWGRSGCCGVCCAVSVR